MDLVVCEHAKKEGRIEGMQCKEPQTLFPNDKDMNCLFKLQSC